MQVYCGDIRLGVLNFSKSREEHLVHVPVRMVLRLETLRQHKLRLYTNASKCQFGYSSIGFLGHGISECGVVVARSPPSRLGCPFPRLKFEFEFQFGRWLATACQCGAVQVNEHLYRCSPNSCFCGAF